MNFFCGMHLVVNMAESCSETLKLFERSIQSNETDKPTSESVTVRLIRTVSKSFGPKADEKSGYPIKFMSFLRQKGINRQHLAKFKGNRFNILFHNAAVVFFLHSHIELFLTTAFGAPNNLLLSVLNDVKQSLYLAGCKALGLIDKFITTPLWRLLESSISILDLPELYADLLDFLSDCSCNIQKVNDFISGTYTPFPGIPINRDDIYETLMKPCSNEINNETSQILQALFQSLELLLIRYQDDQSTIEDTRENRLQTRSVPKNQHSK